MHIIELKNEAEFTPAFPLIKQLNPAMTKAQFGALLADMLPQGYRCIAAIETGAYLGIAGFWQGTRFWCGRFIDCDNVVVDEKGRSLGVGAKLLAWIEKEAARKGCAMVGLDCYTSSHAAQRFYFREGYIIKGYHFVKYLEADNS